MRITKTGRELLIAGKRAQPVLVILIHPKVDYAGKDILLSRAAHVPDLRSLFT